MTSNTPIVTYDNTLIVEVTEKTIDLHNWFMFSNEKFAELKQVFNDKNSFDKIFIIADKTRINLKDKGKWIVVCRFSSGKIENTKGVLANLSKIMDEENIDRIKGVVAVALYSTTDKTRITVN